MQSNAAIWWRIGLALKRLVTSLIEVVAIFAGADAARTGLTLGTIAAAIVAVIALADLAANFLRMSVGKLRASEVVSVYAG